MRGTVISLCDRTGIAVKPWADAGYMVITVDLQPSLLSHTNHTHLVCDVRELAITHDWPNGQRCVMAMAAPPCTHTAVSGARHFAAKGPAKAAEAFQILAACQGICDGLDAPTAIENPVSTFSTYWRKPDHIFHPWQFGGYDGGENDGYTKATCLWIERGFVMPPEKPIPLAADHDRIHKAPPSAERANIRSAAPTGFWRAVYEYNAPHLKQEAA